MAGTGAVYSFTVVRQAFDARSWPTLPYLLALVELDEQPGLLMLANLVDADIEAVEIGDRVEVTFEDACRPEPARSSASSTMWRSST